jgi:hypothetical protein
MSQWRHKITHFPQTISLRHPDRLNRLDLHRLQLPPSSPPRSNGLPSGP